MSRHTIPALILGNTKHTHTHTNTTHKHAMKNVWENEQRTQQQQQRKKE